MKKKDIALELYNSFKGGRKNFARKNRDVARDSGEPKSVADILNELVAERDWLGGLSEGEVFIKWPEIVGEDIASRCVPIEIKENKLFVQCSSTAWATQLNLVKNQVLERIQKVTPSINALEITGPNTPSWRKGLRKIQGERGPRDTYG